MTIYLVPLNSVSLERVDVGCRLYHSTCFQLSPHSIATPSPHEVCTVTSLQQGYRFSLALEKVIRNHTAPPKAPIKGVRTISSSGKNNSGAETSRGTTVGYRFLKTRIGPLKRSKLLLILSSAPSSLPIYDPLDTGRPYGNPQTMSFISVLLSARSRVRIL